jgi:hypothetical protein
MLPTFPKYEKTYAIVFDKHPDLKEVSGISEAIKRCDADNVAVLSLTPYDVKTSPDWKEVYATLRPASRKTPMIEAITHEELEALATTVSVVRAT